MAHAAQGKYDRNYVCQTTEEINFEPFTWPSQPPADCPFESSTEITGLRFNGTCNEFLTPGIAPSIYVSRPARGAHILYTGDST
jgi:hypothetical protein